MNVAQETSRVPTAAGIYMLRNSRCGDVYVGSAFNLRLRARTHLNKIRDGYHDHALITECIKEHGEGFTFKVLERCEPVKLPAREDFWISRLQPKLNRQLAAKRLVKVPAIPPFVPKPPNFSPKVSKVTIGVTIAEDDAATLLRIADRIQPGFRIKVCQMIGVAVREYVDRHAKGAKKKGGKK